MIEPEMFGQMVANIDRLARSEEVQKLLDRLPYGNYKIEFEEVGFQKLLEGISQRYRDIWTNMLKEMVISIDKSKYGISATIAERVDRSHLGEPVVVDSSDPMPVTEPLQALLMKAIEEFPSPRIMVGTEKKIAEPFQFSRAAFKRLVQNINLFIRSDFIQKMLGSLKPGRYEIQLNDEHVQKLVNGLLPDEQVFIAARLKYWILVIEKDGNGISAILKKPLAAKQPFAISRDLPQLQGQSLAGELQDALSEIQKERKIEGCKLALKQAGSMLHNTSAKHSSLLKEYEKADILPQKVREIRRELVNLKRLINTSLSSLEESYEVAKPYLSENEKLFYARHSRLLSLRILELKRYLHPKPTGTETVISKTGEETVKGEPAQGAKIKELHLEREARNEFDNLLEKTKTGLKAINERFTVIAVDGGDQLAKERLKELQSLQTEVKRSLIELNEVWNTLGDNTPTGLISKFQDTRKELKSMFYIIAKEVRQLRKQFNIEEKPVGNMVGLPNPAQGNPRRGGVARPGIRPLIKLTMMMAALFFANRLSFPEGQVYGGMANYFPHGVGAGSDPFAFTWSAVPDENQRGTRY